MNLCTILILTTLFVAQLSFKVVKPTSSQARNLSPYLIRLHSRLYQAVSHRKIMYDLETSYPKPIHAITAIAASVAATPKVLIAGSKKTTEPEITRPRKHLRNGVSSRWDNTSSHHALTCSLQSLLRSCHGEYPRCTLQQDPAQSRPETISGEVVTVRMSKLTPRPFTNNRIKFSTKPTVPFTYCVTRPENRMEHGTMTSAPGIVALRRSSGTHLPPRFFRHRTTSLSERAPAIGAPTARGWVLTVKETQEQRRRTEVADAEGYT